MKTAFSLVFLGLVGTGLLGSHFGLGGPTKRMASHPALNRLKEFIISLINRLT